MLIIFRKWTSEFVGSTRSSAILRFLLGSIIWSRWAEYSRIGLQSDIFTSAVYILFFLASFSMIVGFYSQLSSFITFICLALFYYIIPFSEWNVDHHEYLMMVSTLYVALLPCGKSFSVDRYISINRSTNKEDDSLSEVGNLYAMRLIQLQVAVVYFWSAFDKTSYEFLSGMRLQQIYINYVLGSDVGNVPYFSQVCFLAAVSSVILEFLLSIGLFIEKIKVPLMCIGILFHWVIYISMPVHSFSILICTLYIAFLNPGTVHRILETLVNGSVKNK